MEIIDRANPYVLVYSPYDFTLMADYMRARGLEVTWLATPADVKKRMIDRNDYDLCILQPTYRTDVDLINYARKIDESTPIIFTSEHLTHSLVSSAFEAGADDVVAMPFNIEELILRIYAIIKRSGIKRQKVSDTYQIGSLTFDTKRYELRGEGYLRTLSRSQAHILAVLCMHMGDVVPLENILRELRRERATFVGNGLKTYISNIRKLLSVDESIRLTTIKDGGLLLEVL